MKKDRLDKLLVNRGLAKSRERAKAMIMSGSILVDRTPVDKVGTLVPVDADIVCKAEDIPYVSRGGLKLAAALEALHLDVTGLRCMDIGASTGGFTDCLLQHGAARVAAVDVGYGQLAWKLRRDDRVTVIERANIRHLPETALPFSVDLAAIDVSFISLKIVLPATARFLTEDAFVLALIKPQFEVGKGMVGKGGVVRDPVLHRQVIAELTAFARELGFNPLDVVPSPVPGAKGNREFVLCLRRGNAIRS